MKIWHLTTVALFLLGCDDRATQQGPAGTQPAGPGPMRRDLRLVPKGAVFSADGKLLLTSYAVESWPFHSYKARSLVLWEVETGKKRWAADDTETLEPVGFLPDGKSALVRGYNSLQVWDLAQGRRVSNFPQTPNEFINCVSLSHNAKLALVAEHSQTGTSPEHLDLWDVARRKPIRRFGERRSNTYKSLFFPNDRLALSVSEPTDTEPANVILWDVSTGQAIHSFPKHEYPGHLTGFFPDGQEAFCGCFRKEGQESRLGIWEVSTGKELHRVKLPQGAANAFAPDNRHFLFFGENRISYLDWPNDKLVWSRVVNEPQGLFFIHSVAMSRDGRLAFTGLGSTGLLGGTYPGIRLTLWDVKKGEEVRELSDPRWTK